MEEFLGIRPEWKIVVFVRTKPENRLGFLS